MILEVDLYFIQFQKLRSPSKNSGFNKIQTRASSNLVEFLNQLS